jgi:hypothetical protein
LDAWIPAPEDLGSEDLASVAADLEPGSDGGFVTAPHEPLPLLARHTGTVLANVKLVTVTFANDNNRAKAESFGDYVVGSKWLQIVGADYGVGLGTHQKVELPQDAPGKMTDAELVKSVWQWIGNGTLPSDPQAFYMIYFPSGTMFDASPLLVGILCQSIGAYHWNARQGNAALAYGVYVDCGPNWDPLTQAVSHELVEAATDPFGDYHDGYFVDVQSPNMWIAEDGFYAEAADLCEGDIITVRPGNWVLATSWSNSAAAAGSPPCVPVAKGVDYYNVSPSPATLPTLAAGATTTFTLTGWSTAPRTDWQLTAVAASRSDLQLADLKPTFAATSINNGRTTKLTLTVPATAKSGQLGAVDVVSGPARFWPVGFIVQ